MQKRQRRQRQMNHEESHSSQSQIQPQSSSNEPKQSISIQQAIQSFHPQSKVKPYSFHQNYLNSPQDKEQEQEKRASSQFSGVIFVTQEMIDLAQIRQNDFVLPSPLGQKCLYGSFVVKTENDPPSSIGTIDQAKLVWNGISRLIICPTTTTMTFLENGIETSIIGKSITFKAFHLTMGPLTLSEMVLPLTGSLPGTMTPEAFVETQGISYTLSVLTGKELQQELEKTFQNGGQQELYNLWYSIFYHVPSKSFIPQSTSNYTFQYQGTYAIETQGAKVEPLSESCLITTDLTETEIVLVTLTQDENKQYIMSTELVQNTQVHIPTEQEFHSGSPMPIFGMIHLDLPEDLISNVYTYGSKTQVSAVSVLNMATSFNLQIEIE